MAEMRTPGTAMEGRSETPSERERVKTESAQPIGKVIEIIGNSKKGIEDAVASAVREACATLDHVTGVEIRRVSAKIRDDQIAEWRVDLKLAFGVEHGRGG